VRLRTDVPDISIPQIKPVNEQHYFFLFYTIRFSHSYYGLSETIKVRHDLNAHLYSDPFPSCQRKHRSAFIRTQFASRRRGFVESLKRVLFFVTFSLQDESEFVSLHPMRIFSSDYQILFYFNILITYIKLVK